jgi:hypothetical protein
MYMQVIYQMVKVVFGLSSVVGSGFVPDLNKPDPQHCLHVKNRIPYLLAVLFSIDEALAKEILDAYGLVGRAINKKHEHHKLCEQNRAYAHYRRTK